MNLTMTPARAFAVGVPLAVGSLAAGAYAGSQVEPRNIREDTVIPIMGFMALGGAGLATVALQPGFLKTTAGGLGAAALGAAAAAMGAYGLVELYRRPG